MIIIPQIFPQSRTITHPCPTRPMSNHEHLGQNMIAFRGITTFFSKTMIAFREITTFFSKTMIAFRRKPHSPVKPHQEGIKKGWSLGVFGTA